MTDQPDMQQSDHPEHSMPPTYSSMIGTSNDTISTVMGPEFRGDENRGQGPTPELEALNRTRRRNVGNEQ